MKDCGFNKTPVRYNVYYLKNNYRLFMHITSMKLLGHGYLIAACAYMYIEIWYYRIWRMNFQELPYINNNIKFSI